MSRQEQWAWVVLFLIGLAILEEAMDAARPLTQGFTAMRPLLIWSLYRERRKEQGRRDQRNSELTWSLPWMWPWRDTLYGLNLDLIYNSTILKDGAGRANNRSIRVSRNGKGGLFSFCTFNLLLILGQLNNVAAFQSSQWWSNSFGCCCLFCYTSFAWLTVARSFWSAFSLQEPFGIDLRNSGWAKRYLLK